MSDPDLKTLLELFRKHLDDDREAHNEFREAFKRIEDTLQPISETYSSVSNLGRWLMTLLVALSLVFGTLWAAVQIFTNKP
jgi:hypothetical protein